MKKKYSTICLAFVLPFLLANSPAPNPYPDKYDDYQIDNLVLESKQDDITSQYYYNLSGVIKNTGSRYIDLGYCDINIYIDSSTKYISFYFVNGDYSSCNILKNNEAVVFSQKQYSVSPALVADKIKSNIDITKYTCNIAAYKEDDVLNNVTSDSEIITLDSYNAESNYTTGSVSLNVNNGSGHIIATTVVRFSIGSQLYSTESYLNIYDGQAKKVETQFHIDGNVLSVTPEIVDVIYLKIDAYYENRAANNKKFTIYGICFAVVLGLGLASIPLIVYLVNKKKLVTKTSAKNKE